MAEHRPTDDRQEERDRRAAASDPSADGTDESRSTGLPPKLERWRRRSAAGAIMTGFALGLQQVFEPEKKEPSIMLETSGDPPGDLPVDTQLDGITARDSVVRIRPWLLERTGGSDDAPLAEDGPSHDGSGPEPSGTTEP